jgi:hypothetical protein
MTWKKLLLKLAEYAPEILKTVKTIKGGKHG